MGKIAIVHTQFNGGFSTDNRIGIKNSQQYTQGFDFRKNPSQMSVLPGLTREDNGIVKDLVLNEVMAANGVTYSCGNAGYIYKRTVNGIWSVEGKMSVGTAGLDYRKDTDAVYATSDKAVSYLSPITKATSANPTVFVPDKYASSISTYNNSSVVGFNVNADQTGSALSTAILVATNPLNETSTNIRYFQTDIEPLNKISIFIVAKGTGDWTLTLHDGLNSVLATSTVTNANLKNNDWNDFFFTTAPNAQVRVYPAPNARTYHIHVTSTVPDGTVASSGSNDLSTADLEIWADRLIVTNNGLHPIDRFLQYECIGNSNYLSVWEPISDPPTNAEWRRHALVFPEEYEVCGLTVQNEFLVIAAEKNTTLNTSIPQAGILFFWDGTSPTYNYFVEIPEGSPQAIHTYKNVAYYYCNGDWYGITSATSTPVKIRRMPNSDTEFSGAVSNPVTVYPYASAVRRGILLMAYPSVTTNTNIGFGVYSWGSVDKNFPESFGLNYIISTGSQNYSASNNLQIGMVQAFGDLLHVSWRDDLNGSYGVDVITNASAPAPYAKWVGLTYDGNYASKYKSGMYVECYYYIPANCTVTLGYQIDNNSVIADTNAYSTTNLYQGQPNYARFNVTGNNGGRFHEITPQIEVRTSSGITTPPVIQMIATIVDNDDAEGL